MREHSMLECTKHYSLDMYPNGQVKVNRKSAKELVIVRKPTGGVDYVDLAIPKMVLINNTWEFEKYDPRVFNQGHSAILLHNELLLEKEYLNKIMSLFFSQVM